MSSDDEEEGLGAIVVEPLEEDLNDEDFLGDAGNFTQQIHSTRLIQDSSTGNFLAKNRFDERRLTADGNFDGLFDAIGITHSEKTRVFPSWNDAKWAKTPDDRAPFSQIRRV